MYETDNIGTQHLCESFPYKRPLKEERLLENIKTGSLIWLCSKCNIEVSENLRETFGNFPPTFKNINFGRDDIGPFMKEYAEKEGISTQPRITLISTYFLENGTPVSPLLLFYLYLGLVCEKIYRFVQNTLMKCFNNFVQSPVNARREGDENPNSGAVAETSNLVANSSYGYKIIDRSIHMVKK